MSDDIELPEPSPTAGMTLGERIEHVGGRTNAAGYIEFGSPMAVDALIQYALRDVIADRERRAQGAISERLKDRAVVHANMMRGVIARLSNDQFIHLIGEDLDKLRELQKAVETVIAAHSAGKGEKE